ncbi:MAG: ABC transporter permease [Phycisphaeraceae bacterium]|nr:ABC transporter permease [Phycisphaeraceae bacterium]
MKPIIVQDQVRLGVGRCVGLSLSGMSYRMFRSMITVSILALAVAFLSHVLCYSLLEQSTRLRAYEELTEYRLVGQWVTRLRSADTPAQVQEALAASDLGRVAEYRRWSGASAEAFEGARETAERLDALYAYLNNLPLTVRGVVLGDLDARQILQGAQNPGAYETLMSKLGDLNLRMPVEDAGALRSLVQESQPAMWAMIESIRQGHARAIEEVRRAGGGLDPVELLATSPPQLGRAIEQAGFAIGDEAESTLRSLKSHAQRLVDVQQLKPLLETSSVRAAMARRLSINPREVDLTRTINWLRNESRAKSLADELVKQDPRTELSATRLLALAESERKQDRLESIQGTTEPRARQGLLDLPNWTRWLVLVSFLVCAIGVINAMMMSVTERFTEIATMKCLGALDGFLLLMFFFEAAIQGLLGGLVGVVLGVGLAVLRGWITLGTLVFPSMPWSDVLTGGALSVAAGLLLGAVASIGPAWTAARLAPMEAMRVD